MRKIILISILLVQFIVAKDLKFLTQKEILWLKSLKEPLTIGITTIPNQVIKLSPKKFEGFSIDLFKLIENKLQIKFKYIYFEDWNKLLNSAKKGDIDIVFLAQKTASRLKYFHFTDTVLTQKNKIITTLDKEINSINKLKNKKLALTAGSAILEYIKSYYPNIKIIPTKNEKDALNLVSKKVADATVLELVRASYYIRKYNLNNLTISGNLKYNYYLSIASINSKPQLNVILNKTLKSIKESKIKALKLKWGYIKDKKLFFDKQTLTYLAIAFGIIIPFSIYLFLINQKLKKEMREKQKALNRVIKLRDSKLNEMSQIISMIAHQWRQPLNNLSILIQMLIIKYKKGSLDNKIVQYFEQESKKQIELMSKTIDDFKEFFKINDKKQEFDLRDMILNLIKILSPIFEKENIKIEFLYKNNYSYKVVNYQNMLFQIVLNILNNAKDALIERKIKNRVIKIELQNKKDSKAILIEDSAGGIDEAIIDKIFDPYFSTKTKKNGTGLGLYMAKVMLEEKLNGKIFVKNGAEGAIFEIIL